MNLNDDEKRFDADAICFVPLKNTDCVYKAITNKVYVNNPTITVPDDMKTELDKIREKYGPVEKLSEEEELAMGREYTKFYNKLLTKEHSSQYVASELQTEYNDLVDAVANARKHFASKKPNSLTKTIGKNCEYYTGIEGEYSFYEKRSVINCAEIWNARESILNNYLILSISLDTISTKYF